MRRLNDSELNARINQFLYRKFSEFPELSEEGDRQSLTWRHKLALG